MMPIDELSDDVLLAIFDFCVTDGDLMVHNKRFKKWMEVWQPLVHVCR
jgi:hypothetical protein